METESNSSKNLEKATCKKCKDCRWLKGEKSSVGIECTNPLKRWRSRVAKYKQMSAKACKKFSPRLVDISNIRLEEIENG